jgi:hypothetical protein
MSISSSSKKKPGTNSNRPAYLERFVKDVHRLILAGYGRIEPLGHRDTDERVITQMLVREINAVIGAEGAPKWMERYHATPDRPMDVPGREGPRAPRADIEVILCKGVRPRFHFECKRLGHGNSVKKYLGKDGLGCFLREEYARGCGEGGMLGYVQSEGCASWAGKIESSLLADRNGYRLVANSKWESYPIVPEIPQCYRTQHSRPTMGSISIYHSLLLSYQPSDS